MKKFVLFISIILLLISIISIFLYNHSINLQLDFSNITSVEIVSDPIFEFRNTGKSVREVIESSNDIEKYIKKLNQIRFYESSDNDFGQRDFTTIITLNYNDGSKINILFVSIECRVQKSDSNMNIIKSNSKLYYISPFSLHRLTNIKNSNRK